MHPEYSEEDNEQVNEGREQETKQGNKQNKKEKFEPIAGYQSELHIEKEFVCGYCNLVMKSKNHHVKCPKCGKDYEQENESDFSKD